MLGAVALVLLVGWGVKTMTPPSGVVSVSQVISATKPGALGSKTSRSGITEEGEYKALVVPVNFDGGWGGVRSPASGEFNGIFGVDSYGVGEILTKESNSKLQIVFTIADPLSLPKPSNISTDSSEGASAFAQIANDDSFQSRVNRSVRIGGNRNADLDEYDLIVYIYPHFNTHDEYVVNTRQGVIIMNGDNSSGKYLAAIGSLLGLHSADLGNCDSNFENCHPTVQGDPLDTMGTGAKYFDSDRRAFLKWVNDKSVTRANQGKYSIGEYQSAFGMNNISVDNFYFVFDKTSNRGDNSGLNVKVANGSGSLLLNDREHAVMVGNYFKAKKWKAVVLGKSTNNESLDIFIRFDEAVGNVRVRPETLSENTGRMKISWYEVSRPAGTTVGYKVYRNGSLISDTGVATSYTDTPTGGGPYTYKVLAYDMFAELPGGKYDLLFSSPVTVNTTTDTAVSEDDPTVTATGINGTFIVPCIGTPIEVNYMYTGGTAGPWECQVQASDQRRYIKYSNAKGTQCGDYPGNSDLGEDTGVTCILP